MAARPAKVTQAEVARAVKGALEAGFPVGCVEVNPRTGAIRFYREGTGSPGPDQLETGGRNSCDDVFGL